mmetsp:Transcript_6706/g.21064  ORF Transcript_6706/g.21064 Transcript_6706/m.21064 type:complete len:274 (+) Transcript_6706:274-1095(+)
MTTPAASSARRPRRCRGRCSPRWKTRGCGCAGRAPAWALRRTTPRRTTRWRSGCRRARAASQGRRRSRRRLARWRRTRLQASAHAGASQRTRRRAAPSGASRRSSRCQRWRWRCAWGSSRGGSRATCWSSRPRAHRGAEAAMTGRQQPRPRRPWRSAGPRGGVAATTTTRPGGCPRATGCETHLCCRHRHFHRPRRGAGSGHRWRSGRHAPSSPPRRGRPAGCGTRRARRRGRPRRAARMPAASSRPSARSACARRCPATRSRTAVAAPATPP